MDPDKNNLQPPEPEGGPSRRMQAFLNERAAAMQPPGKAAAPGRRVAKLADEEMDVEGPDLQKLADLRVKQLEKYRERQVDRYQKARRLPKGRFLSPTPLAPSAVSGNNWIPIGPSAVRDGQAASKPTVSGRVRGIAVVPGGTRIYVATANGGVWRSEDTGVSWRSLMDDFDKNPTQFRADSLACGAIAVVPGETAAQDKLFVGTGEASGGGAYFGVGPAVSLDGGATWRTYKDDNEKSIPSLNGKSFYALAVDPGNSEFVVAATTNGIYRRESPGGGKFKWNQKAFASSEVNSVVAAHRDDKTTFYAAVHKGNVFQSTDGGIQWDPVGKGLSPAVSGFPTARTGRIGLAVHPNNPDIIYALIAIWGNPPSPPPVLPKHGNLLGLYRLDLSSDDKRWYRVKGIPDTLFHYNPTKDNGQGNYDMAIAVAPDNVNRIYIGGALAISDPDGKYIRGNIGGVWSGSLYRCEITVTKSGNTISNVSAVPHYIGGSVHADIHTLAFAPGEANKLWVGCDGGVYYSTNPTENGLIFKAKNNGLQTLTMHHLTQHPKEDAVLFCGTQDNGGLRFTGEEVWLLSTLGDCGFMVINWHNPLKILSTGYDNNIRHSSDGGNPANITPSTVPIGSETVLFYAPLVGTPYNPKLASPDTEANLVAFGATQLWVSKNFGSSWNSFPINDTNVGTSIGPIRSIVFAPPKDAAADKLYVGTYVGRLGSKNFTQIGVYRFDKSGDNWISSANLATDPKLPNATVTDIAVDLNDKTGKSIYVTFAGSGNYGRVWHYNGTDWENRSGTLLNVQHNAIVVDPGSPDNIYVGADIGVWHGVWDSSKKSTTWTPIDEGLPDAAVLDLKIHSRTLTGGSVQKILRASTHGRGVYERNLAPGNQPAIELYVRDTQLDQGRFTTKLDPKLKDPTDPAKKIDKVLSPDIKVDTPNSAGSYQYLLDQPPDFVEFVDQLEDKSQIVGRHARGIVTSRVYVQVHNRGVTPASNVRVMLLLANAKAGLPALPAGYQTSVQNGTPITGGGWRTVGIETLNEVRVGFPRIAAFNLTSDLLPAPDDKFVVLPLIHHADDPYSATETNVETNTLGERKTTYKLLRVVKFTGTLPVLNQRVPLNGYVPVPASATAAEAPLDGFLFDAFRINDETFHKLAAAVLASPLVPNGADDDVPDPSAKRMVSARTITLTSTLNLLPKTPLVWFASEKITINNIINAVGKGAQNGESGDFGGSGGGGAAAAGQPCLLPVSDHQFLAGGAANAAGNNLPDDWATRALLTLALCKGGAAGGEAAGGAGGGVVFMCAPVIKIGDTGKIDARGADGSSGNAGGGGGGLVVLIARDFIDVHPDQNVLVDGGKGKGNGRNGGRGLVMKREFR